MESSLRTVALTAVYLTWFGSGTSAYRVYPSQLAYLYIIFAVIVTVIIVWFMYYTLQQREEIEADTEKKRRFDEITGNVHFPCGDPRNCVRCSGFYWGFAVAATVTGAVLSGVIYQSNISSTLSWLLVGIGTSLFIVSVTIHGLLNALIKLGYIEQFEFLVSGRVKLTAGLLSGISLVSLCIGIATLLL